MNTISLPYGKGKVSLKIPAGIKYRVLNIKPLAPIENFRRTFNRSLDKPIGTLPFNKIFTSGDRVAIVIPDKSRRGYFSAVLELLVKRLKRLGISHNRIKILIARGIHPAHTPRELKELVGKRIYHSIKIIDHNAGDKKQSVYLGKTSYGTRVEINRAAVEADKVITCGVIQYHYYAGFSGGRKLIMPGIAGYETIHQNHRLVLNPEPRRGKNPNATIGKLAGNPVNEDMIEATQMLGVDFSIDLVLNHKHQIARIFCGDMIQAHKQGCRLVDRFYSVKLKQPVDCIITSTGGYPTDINFIQTHKTMEQASKGLKPGGILLVLAECSQGIGSDSFLFWSKYTNPIEMELALRKDFVVNGHTALCSLIKAQRFRIYLYSHLSPQITRRIHLTPVKNLQQTLKEFLNSIPRSPRLRRCGAGRPVGLPKKPLILIIPQGFSLLPQIPNSSPR